MIKNYESEGRSLGPHKRFSQFLNEKIAVAQKLLSLLVTRKRISSNYNDEIQKVPIYLQGLSKSLFKGFYKVDKFNDGGGQSTRTVGRHPTTNICSSNCATKVSIFETFPKEYKKMRLPNI